MRNRYLLIYTALFFLAITGSTVSMAGTGANRAAVNPDRLWLPPSARDLRPALEEAARRALMDPDCNEILYGRLNDYRTEHGEPSLTILCQKDPRNTFNLVFSVTELGPAFNGEDMSGLSNTDAETNLEALRRMLMSNQELQEHMPQRQSSGSADNAEEQTDPEEESSVRDLDDLELDLDTLLRTRSRTADEPPELF